MIRFTSLLAVVLLCAACATTGPVSGAAVAGAVALVSVWDQLLTSGVLTPEQYQAIVAGIGELQSAVDAVSSRPALGADEAAGIAGGTAAGALVLLRSWQALQRRRAATPPPAS